MTARHPVIRTGEREPIPPLLRSLVYERDSGRCRICGDQVVFAHAQLDHLVPWSAGGRDTADNLRVAHDRCNEARSNYATEDELRPLLPVTPMCAECIYTRPGRVHHTHPGWHVYLHADRDSDGWFDDDPHVRAWCGFCEAPRPTPVWNVL